MSTRLDKALSVTMTLCAVALVAIVIAREFGVTPSQTTAAVPEPTLVENWREVLAQGMQVGDEDADVQLVEFVDFQCPFCARFHNEVLPRVLDARTSRSEWSSFTSRSPYTNWRYRSRKVPSVQENRIDCRSMPKRYSQKRRVLLHLP